MVVRLMVSMELEEESRDQERQEAHPAIEWQSCCSTGYRNKWFQTIFYTLNMSKQSLY